MSPSEGSVARVPPRALGISLLALAVPVVGALLLPESLGEYGALLWLLALVPAFLFAYHRGWRGAATALAGGMATLSITQAIASSMGLQVPEILLGIVIAYVTISLAIGWLAEIMHRDRSEVEEMAFTDSLTGLPNRRHAEVFLANEFAAAQRGRALCVVLFDLDHFKGYNDQWGHPAGDAALQAFAEVLAHTTRRMNLAARFGGEEFIAVLAGSDPVGASIFADRVRIGLRERGLGDGPLSCSAGVAAYDDSMMTPDDLLEAADRSLYDAKAAGRDRVKLHRPADGAQVTGEVIRREAEVGHHQPLEFSDFGRDRTILVVEDEAPVRMMLTEYLRKEGFHVLEGETVADGMRHLDDAPDVAVVDLGLPDASGHELVAELKRRYPDVPVLIATGVFEASMAADALKAGADRYLFKPFGIPELRAHLQRALDMAPDEADPNIEDLRAESAERKKASHEDVLRGALSLVRAVEVRDPYTRGHSARVASIALQIADHLDPDEVLLPRDRFSLGCEMHDVGKIGIPDLILNKTSRLTETELETIRDHPRVGRRILEPLLDDPLVLGIVNWHHERWDGQGYPDGLQGDTIPLGARVVAVADALSAMTHPRAHREALAWEEALSEIRKGDGTRYDPRVVESTLEIAGDLAGLVSTSEGDQ